MGQIKDLNDNIVEMKRQEAEDKTRAYEKKELRLDNMGLTSLSMNLD
jgi:hypothetical protein